jgi:endonuclease/exonuclease/phosphatase (EEP) superfamily protein YafD
MKSKYRYLVLEEELMSIDFVIAFLNKIWNTTSRLFWAGLWIFALGLLVWYPLRWWPGDRFWPVRLTNYFMPWLFLGLIPGILIAGLSRRRWLATALTIPTILIGLTFAPLFLPRPSTALAGTESYKVMSYNIWGRNRDAEALVSVIQQEQPDILLLQEVTWRHANVLQNGLTELYKHDFHMAYESRIGQAVISRYPLTSVEAAYQKGRTQKVIADTPNGPIAIWNTHPTSPLPWSRQYRQISALVDDIAATEQPLIVGGDFNTTDQSETYRMIDQYLDNAHWEAGWGFGFSFPSSDRPLRGRFQIPSLVRIDHIFYSDHFYVLNARTLPTAGGSDHLPVVAELSLVVEN